MYYQNISCKHRLYLSGLITLLLLPSPAWGHKVLFSQPGAYMLELTGQPVKTGDFQPLRLEFDTIVTADAAPPKVLETISAEKTEPKNQTKKSDPQSELLTAMLGTIGIMAFGIGGMFFLRKWLKN